MVLLVRHTMHQIRGGQEETGDQVVGGDDEAADERRDGRMKGGVEK